MTAEARKRQNARSPVDKYGVGAAQKRVLSRRMFGTDSGGLVTTYNLFDPKVHEDPYPFANALREEGDGIHPGPFPGTWWLSRYDDVARIQRDTRAFVTMDPLVVPIFAGALNTTVDDPRLRIAHAWSDNMLWLDPPQHRRLRSLVSRAFTPSAIAAMRPITEKIAEQLLDKMEVGAEVNLVDVFAAPLPVYVIASMLGFDTDNPEMVPWSMAVAEVADQTVGFHEGPESTLARGAALIEHVEEVIAARRANPKSDLISELCKAENDGDTFTHDELVAMVVLLLAAGNITTTHLIDCAVGLLLDNPDEWQRLVDNDDLAPSAVEEVLRLAPSIQFGGRKAVTDVTFGEREFPAGTELWLLTTAANRDPRHFPDPERFDVGRNDRSHLSFGLGIHTCLGAALARMEGDVALRAIVRRFPNLSAGSSPRVLRGGVATRGFDNLPVNLN